MTAPAARPASFARHDYLTREREKLSTKDLKTIQEKTFFGKEKKSLAYGGKERPEASLFSTGFCFLSPGPAADPKFVFYFVTSDIFQNTKNALAGVGIMGGIKNSDIGQIKLALPPLHEQKRLVAILDETFAGLTIVLANAAKNFRNARRIFDSYLESVFTRTGQWERKTLGELCVKITDGEHLRPKTSPQGVPFLSAKDVQEHDVVFNDPLFVSESDATKFRKRCDPERGDILIVSRGATVGRTCVVKTSRIFCLLGSVILLKVRADVSSRFLAYALKTPTIRNRLAVVSEAAAQQAIYLRDIKPLKIGCPSSAEQQQMASRLDALTMEIQRLQAVYRKEQMLIGALRQSILQKAFSGELTSPSHAIREAAE
jgi:type I restriction enzyme S subunit